MFYDISTFVSTKVFLDEREREPVLNRWTAKRNESVICLFGLVSLFNGISTLFRLFNAKAILLEE